MIRSMLAVTAGRSVTRVHVHVSLKRKIRTIESFHTGNWKMDCECLQKTSWRGLLWSLSVLQDVTVTKAAGTVLCSMGGLFVLRYSTREIGDLVRVNLFLFSFSFQEKGTICGVYICIFEYNGTYNLPGLRSPDHIKAGQFIDCYVGEVITREDADLREIEAGSKPSYLFSLDFLVNDDDIYVVDSQRLGAPTRYMNHSCNPNCRMFPVTRHHGDNRIYDLAFFSLRDLPPMTELTFDYNPTWKGDKTVDPNAVRCLCGEDKCRGQLWPNQRKSTKNEF